MLAAAGRPLTVGEVAVQAARGSEIGIRRSIARLVEQGIVRGTLVGRNRVHELNRDHIAAGVADLLAELRLELWRRLRSELAGWDPAPLYSAVFGSAARADGDESSDIDLLLVHAPLPGEQRSRKRSQDTGWMGALAGADPERWHAQVDRLRGLVQGWTGNPLQVLDLSFYEWWEPTERHRRLLAEVRRDGIDVARSKKLPPAAASEVGVG